MPAVYYPVQAVETAVGNKLPSFHVMWSGIGQATWLRARMSS